jgi:hypothetical protein
VDYHVDHSQWGSDHNSVFAITRAIADALLRSGPHHSHPQCQEPPGCKDGKRAFGQTNARASEHSTVRNKSCNLTASHLSSTTLVEKMAHARHHTRSNSSVFIMRRDRKRQYLQCSRRLFSLSANP